MADVTPGTISKGMPAFDQHLGFFSAPSEDKGITAFQPGHHMALICLFHQQGWLMPSWDRVWSPPFFPT